MPPTPTGPLGITRPLLDITPTRLRPNFLEIAMRTQTASRQGQWSEPSASQKVTPWTRWETLQVTCNMYSLKIKSEQNKNETCIVVFWLQVAESVPYAGTPLLHVEVWDRRLKLNHFPPFGGSRGTDQTTKVKGLSWYRWILMLRLVGGLRVHLKPDKNTLTYIVQACFLCTFEKAQGQNNSMFWPLAKNSRIFSLKTQKLWGPIQNLVV